MPLSSLPPEPPPEEMSLEDMRLQYILDLVMKNKPPDPLLLPPLAWEDQRFVSICEQITDLREMNQGLIKGDLSVGVKSRGFLVSSAQSLQSYLKHMSWQANRIAQGDYTQSLDFLGEISIAFNEMSGRLAEATQLLQNQANHDALTGVPNRAALIGFLSQAFEQAKKSRSPFCIALIDIDHFKRVNDTYGHLVGDEVLKVVARRLQKQVRSVDHFARYGGEEFVAVLVDTRLEQGLLACERMLQCISKSPVGIRDHLAIDITVSLGISEVLPSDASFEQVLNRSDEALYAAKQAGRNCFRASRGPG